MRVGQRVVPILREGPTFIEAFREICSLEAAHDARLVLTDLIERMSLLRRENSELHSAVQPLIAKRDGA
jgi:hypothetical protein